MLPKGESFKLGDPKNIIEYGSIPLHPGTAKFLKEQGVAVPNSLLPPEIKK
jgi:TRAP-type uncharacterized transport system substrate-binding protein